MKSLKRVFRRVSADADAGFALIMVMGIGLVMLIVATAAIGLSVSNIQKAKGDSNFAAAESAAYAGIADYESRLANNNSYYIYGNPASTFSPSGTVSLPASTNLAFGLGSSGTGATWATVPGGDGTATFRYEVDNSNFGSTGVVRLRSTGRVGSSTRTVVANVKEHGFVDFMYFTNYELLDPTQNDALCVPSYDWVGTGHSAQCKSTSEIQFAASDEIKGPVHSNDTIRICGSRFDGTFTTGENVAPYYTQVGGCAAPRGPDNTTSTFVAQHVATISMPPSNAQMTSEYRTDLPTTVPNPGCLYTGPTSVVFNSDGTMTVKSPFTVKTEIAINSAGVMSGTTPAKCGIPGTAAGQLGSPAGATFSVINSNLMYVQDVPAATNNVNYRASGTYPANFTCNSASTLSGWKFGSGSNVIQYPAVNETTPTATPVNYSCTAGDIYTSGSMHGTMTMYASNYIYVTGNLTYANPLTDMLGLVGNNAVWVYNPFNGNTPLVSGDRTIDAAILSLTHTFTLQNYNKGSASLGTLNILGAIAQQYRGTVATLNSSGTVVTGFSKSYVYDTRLQYQAPPKFLSPVSATFGVSQLVEVQSPFNADGSYKP